MDIKISLHWLLPEKLARLACELNVPDSDLFESKNTTQGFAAVTCHWNLLALRVELAN
jgi:hypothetical protein